MSEDAEEILDPDIADAKEMAATTAPNIADQAVAPDAPTPSPVSSQDPAAAMPSPIPSQPQMEPQQEVHPDAGISPEEKMQALMNFSADTASGELHPKTYQDLFADKSTPAKVGTLFGLLLSGAGSGLTHQPNMLLEMMNKMIDQDFAKQKFNKENARSFLSLQYQHNLQQAQVAEHKKNVLGAQVDMDTKAAQNAKYLKELGIPGAEDYYNNYNKKAQEIWSSFEVKPKMRSVIVNGLEKASINNPRAQATLETVVKPAVEKANAEDIAAGAAAVKTALTNSGRSGVVNEKKLGDAIRSGQMTPQGMAYLPGSIAPKDVSAIQDEKKLAASIRNAAYDYDDSFKKLAKMGNAGEVPGVTEAFTGAGTLIGALTGGLFGGGAGTGLGHAAGQITQDAFERERNIEKETLKQRIGKDMSSDDREATVEAMLPSWKDTPESMEEAYRKGMQHFKSQEITPTLDTYSAQIPGLKTPFPAFSFKFKRPPEKKTTKKFKEVGGYQ